ncbi:MAG: hypothetical protein AM326_12420 [Candidatus Thorarchaeota archaeon SMTZ-45]|nr:MAG: hypothetical protein AM326_12420 [Candidatus Thorarchaeota archaeon SMTZ-45]
MRFVRVPYGRKDTAWWDREYKIEDTPMSPVGTLTEIEQWAKDKGVVAVVKTEDPETDGKEEYVEAGELKSRRITHGLKEKLMKDLTYGTDLRGDEALFIEKKHFDGFSLDVDVGSEPVFFRAITKDGVQTATHGWAQNKKVIQWG